MRDARNLLRYLASELNRLFFQLWNLAQLGIGGAALWLLWGVPDASRLRVMVVGMLAVVVFLTVWVTPEILAVGRSLDFVPRDPATSSPEQVRDAACDLHHPRAAQMCCRCRGSGVGLAVRARAGTSSVTPEPRSRKL